MTPSATEGAAPRADAGTAPAVSLRGVVRRMGRETVLRGIDVDVAPGRLVVLRGSNGSGKTTLLKLLATRLRPHQGEGRVFGHDLVREADAVRAKVGLLGSYGGNYPVLSGRENLRLALSLTGKQRDEGAVDAALERVGLAGAADKQVRFYSSGMKKRLGLARQLLVDADLWLLDEPYAALDELGKRLVDVCLLEARSRGRTLLVASHEQDRHDLVPDAVLELDGGRLRMAAFRPAAGATGGAW